MREYISHKDTTMGKQSCFRRTLCMLACFVKTVTSLTVQVAIGQQTTIPCSLAATLPAFTGPGGIAYTNEDDATLNPSLSASLKARLAIIDGNLVISNTESSDAGSYSCTYSGQGQDDNILEVGCEFLTAPSNGAADTLFGMPGDLVTFSCEDGYTLEGDSTLTCQANYTWNATVPVCKGTTTTTTTTTSTSTTTTTTPPPTTTTTIPSTTTTTSTMTTTTTPTTTTTTSTITTTPMPTTRTTTTTTPSTTARPTTQSPPTTPITSTSVTPSTTTPSNTRGESNTSLIAMIVVVSVIGGILVIAIVFMILVMVYGKSGLPLITHRKGTHHRPPFHHHHHRHHKHHKRRERSEHSFYQPQNVLAGYSFYRGGVENPVFQESMDYPNSPDLHYKDANEGLHAPRYDEQPPEYQYAVNWEYGVD